MNDTLSGSDYTILEFKLNCSVKYCIWYLDENDDEEFLKTNGKIRIYKSKGLASEILCNQNINYNIISYDLDIIISSIKNSEFNSTDILDFINIVTDITKTFNTNIHEDEAFGTIYDKLFYGENLSTINQSNNTYHPIFENEEIEVLKKYIEECIIFIKHNIFYDTNLNVKKTK